MLFLSVREIPNFQKFKVIVIMWNVASAVTDTLIAVSMSWYLVRPYPLHLQATGVEGLLMRGVSDDSNDIRRGWRTPTTPSIDLYEVRLHWIAAWNLT